MVATACASSGDDSLDRIEAADVAVVDASLEADDACYPVAVAPDDANACVKALDTELTALLAYKTTASEVSMPMDLTSPLVDCREELDQRVTEQKSLIGAVRAGVESREMKGHLETYLQSSESTDGCDRLVDEQRDRSSDAFDQQSRTILTSLGIVTGLLLLILIADLVISAVKDKRSKKVRRPALDPLDPNGSESPEGPAAHSSDPVIAALERIAGSLESSPHWTSQLTIPLIAAILGSVATALVGLVLK